jgi:hypothetical protein
VRQRDACRPGGKAELGTAIEQSNPGDGGSNLVLALAFAIEDADVEVEHRTTRAYRLLSSVSSCGGGACHDITC